MCVYNLQIQIDLCSVAIRFTTEIEDKDFFGMIWVRDKDWKKSSVSPQPY